MWAQWHVCLCVFYYHQSNKRDSCLWWALALNMLCVCWLKWQMVLQKPCATQKKWKNFSQTQKTCRLTLTKMTDHIVENCSKTWGVCLLQRLYIPTVLLNDFKQGFCGICVWETHVAPGWLLLFFLLLFSGSSLFASTVIDSMHNEKKRLKSFFHWVKFATGNSVVSSILWWTRLKLDAKHNTVCCQQL